MYIVTRGTSTFPHLTKEYLLPTHDSLEKLDITLQDLLSAESVWMWRVQTQDRASQYTHTLILSHLQKQADVHILSEVPLKVSFPISIFLEKRILLEDKQLFTSR